MCILQEFFYIEVGSEKQPAHTMHKRNVLIMIDNLHQQWEVPRYDLTTNPHRLVPIYHISLYYIHCISLYNIHIIKVTQIGQVVLLKLDDLTTNPHMLLPLGEKIRLNDNSDQFLFSKI